MKAWQKCSDLRDAIPLYKSRGLFLKPVAQLHISVYLPQLKAQAGSVSNGEIVEKLKQRIHPEEFTSIKVSKSTLQFIRFDGEVESKCKLKLVLAYLDSKTIKVSGFSELLKIRAVEAKPDFPSKYDWDSFFRDAKDMNEMKVGERPDTIYLANLPCKWFTYGSNEEKPSERLIGKIFEQFGEVSRIDIPMLDPFRHNMNSNISGIKQFTFNQNMIFEAYVQFKEYFCFVKAMDAFRGMKLVYMDEKKNAFMASIKVDFDKSKHLSDASVRRRQIVRERLEKKEKETLEKKIKEREEEEKKKEAERQDQLERRKRREEKRKQRQLEKLKQKEMENINEKIAVEEYLLLMAQRKLESIRLLGELIKRVKNEKDKEKKEHKYDDKTNDENSASKKNKLSPPESQIDTEKDLRYKLIQKFKRMQEKQITKETTKLKSLVSEATRLSRNATRTSSISSDTASECEYHDNRGEDRHRLHKDDDSYHHNAFGNRRMSRRFNRNGRGRSNDSNFNQPQDEFPNFRGRFSRGRRSFGRPPYQNSWRGRYHAQYMLSFMDPMLLSYSQEYYKYLQKIARESRRSRSRSRSYSKSRSRSRSYSRGRFRSYTRSYSRSYSRSRSRSRRSSWSSSRSRSRDRSRHSRTRSLSKHAENADPAKQPNAVPDSETVKTDKVDSSVHRKHKKNKKKSKKRKKSKSQEKKEETKV